MFISTDHTLHFSLQRSFKKFVIRRVSFNNIYFFEWGNKFCIFEQIIGCSRDISQWNFKLWAMDNIQIFMYLASLTISENFLAFQSSTMTLNLPPSKAEMNTLVSITTRMFSPHCAYFCINIFLHDIYLLCPGAYRFQLFFETLFDFQFFIWNA